jgi:hypothetical protein
MTEEFRLWAVQMKLEGKLPYGLKCPWGMHIRVTHDEPSCRVFRSDVHKGGYFIPCNHHLRAVFGDKGNSAEIKDLNAAT